MLVFYFWLKDMEAKTNLEAVQLIKDYTTENARGVVEFHLDPNSTWDYQELIGHLRTSFESGETLAHWLAIFTAEFSSYRKQKTSLLISCKY